MAGASGFWSYVHKDDEATHGAIRRLAKHVSEEYSLLTGGQELNLFLDHAKIEWGDDWRSKIREALEATTFFIPIVTPRYFGSEECRKELLGFAEQAGELGLKALIMPIYFVSVPAFDRKDLDDPAVRLVAESQREDWRNLRLLDETTQPYRLAVNRLADRLMRLDPGSDDDGEERPTSPDDRPSGPELVTLPAASEDVGEMGMLELLVEGEETLPVLVEQLQGISAEIQQVGELAEGATAEVRERDARGEGFKGRLAVARHLARDLEAPAGRLEELSSQYMASLLVVDPAVKELIRMAQSQSTENPDEVEEFFASIGAMVDGSATAADGIGGLIEALDGSAGISRELQKPIKRMRVSLQSLLDGNSLIASWREAIEKATAPAS